MADIYGKLTEHPEYPVEDARHFTVEIKPHDYVPPRSRLDATRHRVVDPFCDRCGFHRVSPVHPREER